VFGKFSVRTPEAIAAVIPAEKLFNSISKKGMTESFHILAIH
jgi:hypothetical protein